MNRTAFMQEVLQMRFKEVLGGWQSGRLTQEEASRVLGVSERTFRRQLARYEEGGLEGLRDKRLGQVSHRRAPVPSRRPARRTRCAATRMSDAAFFSLAAVYVPVVVYSWMGALCKPLRCPAGRIRLVCVGCSSI